MKLCVRLAFIFFNLAIGFVAAFTFNQAEAQTMNYTVQIKTVESKAELIAVPEAGHHFNLDAPNRARVGESTLSPVRKSEREFAYAVPEKRESPLRLDLYVCDDANTFCKQQTAAVQISSDHKVTLRPWGQVADATSPGQVSTKVVEKHGFLQNALTEALARAKTQKKKVLIDFAAIWCPACLKLEHEVLETKDFAAVTKDYVKVRIDADWEGSGAIKSKYHVLDMPTLLVVNAEGEELARLHGFQPKQTVLAEFRALNKRKLLPISELRAKADKGDRAARDQMGRLAYDSLNFDEAVRYLQATTAEKERLLIAEIHLLGSNQPAEAGKLEEKLKQAVETYPLSVDTPSRYLRLAELYKAQNKPEEMKKAARQAIISSDREIKNKTNPLSIDAARDDVELLKGDFWAYKARAQALLGEDASASWEKAIDLTRKSITPKDRGRRLILVRYLKRAGRDGEIDSVLGELQQAYPNEYTYYYKRAALFQERSEWTKAEDLGKRAVEHAYGANLIDSALLLSKILQAQKKEAEASRVASDALSKVQAPEDTSSHLAKQIEALRAFSRAFQRE